MSEHKFTPAPWFIMGEVGPQQEILISGDPFYPLHPDPLCHATATGATAEEARANAILIQAAPQMLEALQDCLDHLQQPDDCDFSYLVELIQKALPDFN